MLAVSDKMIAKQGRCMGGYRVQFCVILGITWKKRLINFFSPAISLETSLNFYLIRQQVRRFYLKHYIIYQLTSEREREYYHVLFIFHYPNGLESTVFGPYFQNRVFDQNIPFDQMVIAEICSQAQQKQNLEYLNTL